MSAQRIKGQEISILVTNAGELESELNDVKSAEFSPQFEIKEEGYLGEKAPRFDEIYMGVKGNLTLHIHSGDIFDFLQSLKDRAQRNTPDIVFNISGVFSFPSGEVRTLSLPDVKFGTVPISMNDRGDFVEIKLEFATDDYQVAED